MPIEYNFFSNKKYAQITANQEPGELKRNDVAGIKIANKRIAWHEQPL